MDIASLGIEVESGDLRSGKSDLDEFTGAAEKAEKSVIDFESAAQKASKAANDNSIATKASTKATEASTEAVTKNAQAITKAKAASRGGIIGLVALAATATVFAGVTQAIDDTTEANVKLGDTTKALGQVIGEFIADAFEPYAPAARRAWNFVKKETKDGTNDLIRGVLSAWEVIAGAFEIGGTIIVGGFDALWNSFLDGLELLINSQLPKLNAFIATYNKIAAFKNLPSIDPITPVDFNPENENAKTVAEKVGEILKEREEALKKIAVTDYAGAAFDVVAGKAIQNALDRGAKKAEAEAKRRASERERALQQLASRTERLTQSRIRAEGDVIGLIQRRLQAEKAGLDELGEIAIKNGADAIDVNQKVADAKVQAENAANQEIYNYLDRLRKEDAAKVERQRKEDERNAKRRAEEEARTKDRVRNFDRALNNDGIKPGKNLNNSQIGQSSRAFGTSRQLGRQSPQSQISEILSQEQEMMAELDKLEAERLAQTAGNRDAQLEIEQDFADRRAAIQEEMLQRQKDVMAQAADLALGDAENLFGSLADAAATAFGKQSAAARAFLIAEQGIMIARASMALGPALMNALAAPFPINLAQFATVAALGAQIIGNISNISTAIKGRAQGGFTAGNMIYEVNEGGKPEMFESGGRRYLMPGSNGSVTPENHIPRAGNDNSSARGELKINMIDNAGVSVTAKRMSDDEIKLMIDERTTHNINKKVPKLVAGQLRKPNSDISQSFGSNYKSPRNRP